jgi:hypothetical protein
MESSVRTDKPLAHFSGVPGREWGFGAPAARLSVGCVLGRVHKAQNRQENQR